MVICSVITASIGLFGSIVSDYPPALQCSDPKIPRKLNVKRSVSEALSMPCFSSTVVIVNVRKLEFNHEIKQTDKNSL